MRMLRRSRPPSVPAADGLAQEPVGRSSGHPLDEQLLSLLCCPVCRTDLTRVGGLDGLLACAGGHEWPLVGGVPVFSDIGRAVEVRPIDHTSHQPSAATYARFQPMTRPWLHLGAGATAARVPNSIEFETAVFRHTDLVGDVHHLPFKDGQLGGVLALNVFEHLADPERAAAELRRCLAPGARVVVQTAFMQPLHADPYHFYNTTETGLRRWFREFDIQDVTVPRNFNPAYALSWQCSELLLATNGDARVASATVEQLAAFWRNPATQNGRLWDSFMQLPDEWQRVLAAGFEIEATRPTEGDPT